MKELASKYEHKSVEEGKNKKWVENGYFQEHDLSKEPFSIVIPPPNVTGKLHLGHAWDTTLQDVIIRYKKLQGFDTLWLPGMDHAGIATQAKVDEKLRHQGISRYDLGREKFLEVAWEWKAEYAQHIRDQWGKLGLGLDYSKERFTLDKVCYHAVMKVFVDLYNKGLIYRKERIINWDPAAKTALSNIEVDHIEIDGAEHYFKYFFVDDENEYLEVMTTRPETILGDGAIAVNPDDERYNKLVGKEVYVPISNVKIPIILDDYVSIDQGSGCVKITPAHDPNDFNVGVRHNIPFRIIMDEDGTMSKNEWVPDFLQGVDRFEARKLFLEKAKEKGVLDRIVPIRHNVGHSQRSGAVVEPLLSMQWFVDMESLAKKSIEFQKQDDKINFVPERFEKTFLQWMDNIEDWCISRQLWWGHRIPAWYHNDTNEIYVGLEPPKDIENYTQDEDVLDTWFSSGLWPFETLGWPENTSDFSRYYPTNTLVTGYDIIFFWVARMIFTALEFTDQKPFNDVLIHGLVRDGEGRKMSKSLGNGVDPMDVIEKYGADSLRFFLTTTCSPGQDLRYTEKKVESTWNFINKLWNAARYVEMNTTELKEINIDVSNLNAADKWILTQLNKTIEDVTTNMEKYEYTNVGNALQHFIWNDYCSWYIEMSKATINDSNTKSVLLYVLEAILKMLHPFMPFVTEELYCVIFNKETILKESYPIANDIYYFDNKEMEIGMEIITKLREVRFDYSIKKSIDINYTFDTDLVYVIKYIEKMTNCSKVTILNSEKSEVYTLSNGLKLTTDLSMVEVKSTAEIKAEYVVELEKLTKEINRASAMLSNDKFLSKAPEQKINEEKSKLSDYQAKYDSIKQLIDQLD